MANGGGRHITIGSPPSISVTSRIPQSSWRTYYHGEYSLKSGGSRVFRVYRFLGVEDVLHGVNRPICLIQERQLIESIYFLCIFFWGVSRGVATCLTKTTTPDARSLLTSGIPIKFKVLSEPSIPGIGGEPSLEGPRRSVPPQTPLPWQPPQLTPGPN